MAYTIALCACALLILRTCGMGTDFEEKSEDSTFASCDGKIYGTSTSMCHCDPLCNQFTDCCFGHNNNETWTNDTAVLWSNVYQAKCMSFAGDRNAYFMYGVPNRQIPFIARKYIKSCQEPVQTDILQAFPIYSYQISANFRNMFCYQIYFRSLDNPVELEPIAMWSISLPSDCFQKYFDELNSNHQSGTFTQLLRAILSRTHCNISLVPPEKSTARICFQQDEEGCKDVCQSFQSPVVDNTGKIYKNAECAECSGSHVLSSLHEGEPMDDKQTLLTLNPLPEVKGVWLSERQGRNITCPVNQIRHFNTCIEPIAKVRGYLHQVEVKTSSNETLYMDESNKEKITRVLFKVIKPIADFYTTINLSTEDIGCIRVLKIAIYLRHDVTYKEYVKILNYVTTTFDKRTEDFERTMLIRKLIENKTCIDVETTKKDQQEVGADKKDHQHKTSQAVKGTSTVFEIIRMVIFASIFGGFVLVVAAFTIVKVLINKLARNRED